MWKEEKSETPKSKLDVEYLLFSFGKFTGMKNRDNILHDDRVTCNESIKIFQPPFERINIVHEVSFSEDFHSNFSLTVKSS